MTEIADDPGFVWLRQGKSRLPRTRTIQTKTGSVITYTSGSANTSLAGRASSRLSREERFLARVRRVSNGCWLWTGSVDPDGYGRFFLGKIDGRTKIVPAHRWSYEHHVGPIPDGFVVDHIDDICGHRNCVNPKHLQAVPHGVNVSLGHAARRKRLRKRFCAHNHDMEEVGRRADGTCAECARERVRAHRQKKADDPDYRAMRADVERVRRKTPEYRAKAAEYKRQNRERDNADRRERYAERQRSVATDSTSSPSTL
jgi:hypothetical protein